jgi:L-alanine-DL-glutamate epimerase-like enolase superfamily enzyme
MRTIFACFQNYEDASAAVEELLQKHFEEGKMNAIVQDYVAKGHMDVNLSKVDVAVTDKIGEKTARGLDQLIGGEKGVYIPDVGTVYAAGDTATIVAETAAKPGAADGGLKGALVDFRVPEDLAETYRAGIKGGGVLFWIRADDDRGSEAAEILRSHKAEHVSGPTLS